MSSLQLSLLFLSQPHSLSPSLPTHPTPNTDQLEDNIEEIFEWSNMYTREN